MLKQKLNLRSSYNQVKIQTKGQFYRTNPKTANNQTKISEDKKRSLSGLIQKYNADSIQQMVNSRSEILDSQKTKQSKTKNKIPIPNKNIKPFCLNNMLVKSHKSEDPLSKQKEQDKTPSQTFKTFSIQKSHIEENISEYHPHQQNEQQYLGDSIQISSELNKIKQNSRLLDSNFYFKRESTVIQMESRHQMNITFDFDSQLDQLSWVYSNSQNSGNTPHIGLNIQDFQKISHLGEGVYGLVSLSRHKETNMIVALKKIQKASMSSQNSVYLSREIKIQSFADHPNIVQLYTFFHDEHSIYLALEVCNEGNLFSILQRQSGEIPLKKVIDYIRQICKAVQFLHNHQIIHRDIKPENILVHNGVAKLCDFGWAVYAPVLRETLCGTPLYSCPEIVKGQKYDKKIDIWSIGILTFELIFRTVPFDIRTQQDLPKVVQTNFQFPSTPFTSGDCQNFINGCLQKQPKDRFQIWQLLRHPFLKEQQKIRDSLKVSLDQVKN